MYIIDMGGCARTGPEGRAAPCPGDDPAQLIQEVTMDYDVLMQFIQTLGFPIVVCCALFWYVNKQAESHKDEIDSLRTTIQDNTTLLHEVKELISALIGKAKEL